MAVEEVRPPDEMPEESLSFAMLDEKDIVDEEKKSALDADIEEIQKKHKVRLEKKTSPKYQLNTIIQYLKEHYTFRYDTDSQMLMFIEAPDSKAELRLFQHRDLVNLKNELKMADIKIGREELKDIIESRYVSVDYHPFEEYIYNIPKWDGVTDHFADYLDQVALEDEDQREQFVTDFKKWFVGYVGSVLYEDVVNHQCFVLVGGQGTYKTTFQTQLMPKHLRLHYLFSMKFDFNNKDHLKYLATMGLVLFDELSALGRADEKLLKSTLTAPIVTVRLPYKAYDSHLRRRASFMGNSNEEHFLKDESGSRRFNIFKIRSIKLDPAKKIEPLYAMAHQLFKDGFVYWFAGDDIKKLEQSNAIFKDVSIEEEMVLTYMSKPSDIDVEMKACRMQTASEINNWLAKQSGGRFNVNETTKKRLGMVLKRLGFVKKSERIKGYEYPVQVWCYNKNETGQIDFEVENAAAELPLHDDAPI
jgi:predicted P-loop ATPase